MDNKENSITFAEQNKKDKVMANKNRPKYVQEIVDDINNIFYDKREKDPHCDLAMWLNHYLLSKNMYRGYNFYVDKVDANGNIHKCLAGTSDIEKYEYIQIW